MIELDEKNADFAKKSLNKMKYLLVRILVEYRYWQFVVESFLSSIFIAFERFSIINADLFFSFLFHMSVL